MATQPVTLTECDREPIHLLGAIQPIGFLLSVNADWVIVRASQNVGAYLQTSHADIVGQPVAAHISSDILHDIRGHLQTAGEAGVVEPLFHRRLHPKGKLFAVAVLRARGEIVLEFEESPGGSAVAPTSLRGIMARVERHRPLPAVFREVARQMRALTGYDRVMVYRFDESDCGEVVGESLKSGTDSFIGLRYPASDIPVQARALYQRNLTRIIVDTESAPVAVMPALSPEGEPLDLSMSVLRSVSPIHLEYMRNMQVRSSMSVSVMRGGRLWGLIACHHGSPHHVGLETRLTAELFGQMFSYLLEVREREEDAAYDARAKEIHDRIAPAFASQSALLSQITDYLADLAEYVDADGVGTYSSGDISLTGITPTQDEFLQLVRFLNKTASGRVFSTHDLGSVFEPAKDYVMRAAGIISIPISRMPRDYLVFFRREVVQTVTWAGQPVKAEAAGPNGVRLTPRKSFEAWREIVQGQSKPWTKRELQAAEALRLTLIELVLKLSDIAQNDRLLAEQRQEFLIAELHHRVRNLLGMVRGLVIQSAASATSVQTLVQSLQSRLEAMSRAHDLLTLSETTSGSMRALLLAEAGVYGDIRHRLIFVGPDVELRPKAFSAMALIIHELVTNARKHGALKNESGEVHIETGTDPVGNVTIAWREAGGPPVFPPTRRGFGSTILEQAIAFEINGTSSSRFPPLGFCLDVMLPAETAQLGAGDTQHAASSPDIVPAHAGTAPAAMLAVADGDMIRLLKTSLLVEDSLFIAADAEDLLRKLGAETVVVARSVAEALGVLESQKISFAMLDVNLGTETSLPIARALQKLDVPFAFGTGYGSSVSMPDALGNVPVVVKPYTLATVARAIRQAIFINAEPASDSAAAK